MTWRQLTYDMWLSGKRYTKKQSKPHLWGRSSIGRAPALQAGGRGFDPLRLHHFGPLAQLAEQVAVNHRVGGSSPSGAASMVVMPVTAIILIAGRCQRPIWCLSLVGSKRQPVTLEITGSNPVGIAICPGSQMERLETENLPYGGPIPSLGTNGNN